MSTQSDAEHYARHRDYQRAYKRRLGADAKLTRELRTALQEGDSAAVGTILKHVTGPSEGAL